MIQVDPLPPPRATTRPSRSAAVAGFSVTLGPALVDGGGVAVAGLDAPSLASLQEVVAPRTAADRDRAARGRCRALLAALGRVQAELLCGSGTAVALEQLGTLTAEVADAADPELRATLASTLTRARVELARQGGG